MMQPWQRNVLINKYIADCKMYELNEMIDSDIFDEEQKQLMQEEVNNLESYIGICTKRLKNVDPVDIAKDGYQFIDLVLIPFKYRLIQQEGNCHPHARFSQVEKLQKTGNRSC